MSLESLFLILLAVGVLGGILCGIPVYLVLGGVPLLLSAVASAMGAFDAAFLQAFPARVFGLANNTLLIAVPLFVAMGLLLEKSGAAERMLTTLSTLLGGSRRSLALSVLGVSTLIAASTGIIGATIVMLGLISLPALTRAGIPPSLSSGLICASGTLGQIIPPSIVLILLGDQIGNTYLAAQLEAGNFAPTPVSVADLFAAALVPGLLLVGLYAGWVIVCTWRQPAVTAARSMPVGRAGPDPSMNRRQLFGIFVPPLLLIVAVLGSILGGVATATEAAAIGAAGALLLAALAGQPSVATRRLYRGSVLAAGVLVLLRNAEAGLQASVWLAHAGQVARLVCALCIVVALFTACVALWRRAVLVDVMRRTTLITAMVFGIILGASMLSLVFRGFGGDELIHGLLDAMPGDRWGALLAVMLVVFLLGFLLEFVEIIFIVIPIVGPVLLASDFDPLWIAVLFALNLQCSFLTPPFGFALFYYRSVAPPAISTLAIYRAVLPFVLLQVVALALVLRFPVLATGLPDWLGR